MPHAIQRRDIRALQKKTEIFKINVCSYKW
jgi:hypothetical protein